MISVDASELRELAIDLQRAGGQIGGRAARVLRKSAAAVERDAKELAPVGETGNLRRSISTSFAGDGRFAAMEAEIGPDVDYARFVEEGTSVMAAQPFMGPALARNERPFVDGMVDVAEDLL